MVRGAVVTTDPVNELSTLLAVSVGLVVGVAAATLAENEKPAAPILTPELTVVDELSDTARGTGGFGSTER